jgi:hypothetical protein
MQVSSISSQLQAATNAARSQAVHEQPAFAQLLAAADSDKTTPHDGSNLNPNTAGLTNEISAETTPVSDDLRKAFSDFVGQTFFSELIKSYRSTQQEAAYFNGGRAEKIFQGQLDQIFAEELSESSAEKISEPMFEQFKRL